VRTSAAARDTLRSQQPWREEPKELFDIDEEDIAGGLDVAGAPLPDAASDHCAVSLGGCLFLQCRFRPLALNEILKMLVLALKEFNIKEMSALWLIFPGAEMEAVLLDVVSFRFDRCIEHD